MTPHRLFTHRPRVLRALIAALTLGATLTVPLAVTAGPAAASSTMGGPITWSEIQSRAQYWIDHPPPGGYDPANSAAGPTGESYRADCSGYVSMALHLSNAGGGPSSKGVTTSGQFTHITKDQLQPGDVLTVPVDGSAGHIILFGGWLDSEHDSYDAWEFGGGTAPDHHRMNGYPAGGDSRNYQPYHYTNLLSGSAGPGLPMTAFTSDDATLNATSSAGLQNTAQGMQTGTSPSVTTLASGGHEIAFQTNTHHLGVFGSGGNHVYSMTMRPGTSPSIARLTSGTGYLVAYQNAAGSLSLLSTATGKAVDTRQGMRNGSSPSIATNGTSYQVAFTANTGDLHTWTNGKAADLNYSVKTGTWPAVTGVTGGFEIAFQSGGGSLWVTGVMGTADRKLALAAGSSPAITAVGDGYVVAAPTSGGMVEMVPRSGGNHVTDVRFRQNTSPSITHYDGSYELAVQYDTGVLVLDGASGRISKGYAMDHASSPSIG